MAAKKKAAYDPARQWGLKPEREAAGATYVVQGHVISGADSRSMYVGENVGRDAQAKAARKLSAVDSEKALQRLLKRDREGTKILASAREFSKKQAAELKLQDGPSKKKLKRKVGKHPESDEEIENDAASDEAGQKPRGNAYSATLIKQLGFDPTAKNGQKVKDDNVQSKVSPDVFALASSPLTKPLSLARRPRLLTCESQNRARTTAWKEEYVRVETKAIRRAWNICFGVVHTRHPR